MANSDLEKYAKALDKSVVVVIVNSVVDLVAVPS